MLLGGTAALRGKAGTRRPRLWEDEEAAAVAGNPTNGKKRRRKLKKRERSLNSTKTSTGPKTLIWLMH